MSAPIVNSFFEDYIPEKYDVAQVNGRNEGNGTILYTGNHRGDYLVCQWKNGKLNGPAVLLKANGEKVLSCSFVDDLMHGPGKIYVNGEVVFEGNWVSGYICGQVKEYWEDGMMKFVGEYKDNLRNGNGTEFDENGDKVYSGMWVNGQRSMIDIPKPAMNPFLPVSASPAPVTPPPPRFAPLGTRSSPIGLSTSQHHLRTDEYGAQPSQTDLSSNVPQHPEGQNIAARAAAYVSTNPAFQSNPSGGWGGAGNRVLSKPAPNSSRQPLASMSSSLSSSTPSQSNYRSLNLGSNVLDGVEQELPSAPPQPAAQRPYPLQGLQRPQSSQQVSKQHLSGMKQRPISYQQRPQSPQQPAQPAVAAPGSKQESASLSSQHSSPQPLPRLQQPTPLPSSHVQTPQPLPGLASQPQTASSPQAASPDQPASPPQTSLPPPAMSPPPAPLLTPEADSNSSESTDQQGAELDVVVDPNLFSGRRVNHDPTGVLLDVSVYDQGKLLYVWKSFSNGTMVEQDVMGNKRYEGAFADDEGNLFPRQGEGREFSLDGMLIYEGGWKNDMRSGNGKEYRDQKLIYEGSFDLGDRSGQGILYHNNGKKMYSGLWANGKANGKGTCYDENGHRVASGVWHDNFLDGKHPINLAAGVQSKKTLSSKKPQQKRRSIWIWIFFGVVLLALIFWMVWFFFLPRSGSITYSDNRRWEGGVQGMKANGYGTMYAADGSKLYQGTMRDDKYDGYGELYRPQDGQEARLSLFSLPGLWKRFSVLAVNVYLFYAGQWNMDAMVNGTFFSPQGLALYAGNCTETGVYHGQGTSYWEDGVTPFFSGQWTDGNETMGTFYRNDGTQLYEGFTVGSVYEGKGRMFYSSERLWLDGVWVSGSLNGTASEYFDFDPTTLRFEGEWVSGKKIFGKFYSTNSYVTYEGECLDDEYHGQGKSYYVESQVVKYEGTWSHNAFILGSFFDEEGNHVYEGSFVNDKYDGYGVTFFVGTENHSFEGEWSEGRKVNGTFFTAEGNRIYEGQCNGDSYNGNGRLYTSNAPFFVEFEGVWDAGILTHGVHFSADGVKAYEGEFNSLYQYHGTGTSYVDGTTKRFTGQWENGVQVSGTFFLSNGWKEYEGGCNGELYEGFGTLFFTSTVNIAEFVGQWSAGQLVEGTQYSTDGVMVYRGEFDSSRLAHGTGQSFWNDGETVQFDGEWSHGQFQSGNVYNTQGELLFSGPVSSPELVTERTICTEEDLTSFNIFVENATIPAGCLGAVSTVSFRDFPSLREVTIGSNACASAELLEFSNNRQLQKLVVAAAAFAGDQKASRRVVIEHVTLLEELLFGPGAFRFFSEFVLQGAPNLRVISIEGSLEGESFGSATVLQLESLPSLQQLVLGSAVFPHVASVIWQNLPVLTTVELGENALSGEEDASYVLTMRNLTLIDTLVSLGSSSSTSFQYVTKLEVEALGPLTNLTLGAAALSQVESVETLRMVGEHPLLTLVFNRSANVENVVTACDSLYPAFELLPFTMTHLIVPNNCFNSVEEVSLGDFPYLRNVTIGSSSFTHAKQFVAVGLNYLESIVIGSQSFTLYGNTIGEIEQEIREFRVADCPALRKIHLAHFAFSNYRRLVIESKISADLDE